MPAVTETWWGAFDLEVDAIACWRVGPLTVAVRRRRAEWQVAWSTAGFDTEEPDDAWALELEADEFDESGNFERFVFGESPAPLRVTPALADRPVVSKPRVPFHVLSGEETQLLVGSPLWLRIEAGEPARRLLELPIRRPSDTWFGSSTRVGELCYATRTRAILNVDRLKPLWRHAVTPVKIRNEAPAELALDKLKLPVPNLSVFAAAGNRLWTEALTLVRTEASELASLQIRRGPPPMAAGAEPLTPPREHADEHGLIRAFSSLLGSLV